MRHNSEEIFDIDKAPLYAHKDFIEQAMVIINWQKNNLDPKALFCLSDQANDTAIKRRYRKLCLYFHSDKNRDNERIANQVFVILTAAKDYLLFTRQTTYTHEEKQQITTNIFYQSTHPATNTSSNANSHYYPAFFTGFFQGATVFGRYVYTANNRFRSIDLCVTSHSATHSYRSKLSYYYAYFNQDTSALDAVFSHTIRQSIQTDILANKVLLTENLLGPGRSENFNILHLAATFENADLFVWLLDQGADLSSPALDHWSVLNLAIATQRIEIIRVLESRLGRPHIEQAYQDFLELKISYTECPYTENERLFISGNGELIKKYNQEKSHHRERIKFILEQMPHWSRDRQRLHQLLLKNPALLEFVSCFECIDDTYELALIKHYVQINGDYYRYVRHPYRINHSVIALAFHHSRTSTRALPLFPIDSDPTSHNRTRYHVTEKSLIDTGELSIYYLSALSYLWPDFKLDVVEKDDSHYMIHQRNLCIHSFFIYYVPVFNLLLLSALFALGTLALGYIQAHILLTAALISLTYLFATMGLNIHRNRDYFFTTSFKIAFYISPIYCLLAYCIMGATPLSLYFSLLLGIGLAFNLISVVNILRVYQEVNAIQTIINEQSDTMRQMPEECARPHVSDELIRQRQTWLNPGASNQNQTHIREQTCPSPH